MDRLSELLGHHVEFSYTAWDRIVLNGYLDRLQRPENIIHFFRDVVGVPSVTPEVLMSRTAPYRAWVARYAEEQGIPLRRVHLDGGRGRAVRLRRGRGELRLDGAAAPGGSRAVRGATSRSPAA